MAISMPSSVGDRFRVKGGISIAGVRTPDDTVFVIAEIARCLAEDFSLGNNTGETKYRISIGNVSEGEGFLWECSEDQLFMLADRIVFADEPVAESDAQKLNRVKGEVISVLPELRKVIAYVREFEDDSSFPGRWVLAVLNNAVVKLNSAVE